MRKLALAAALVVGATGVVATGTTEAAKAPCRGRSVYVWRNDPTPCDVRPPQRLHIVGRIGKAACDQHGGRYGYGICWDVDY
jgi:hypothetical protein